MWKKERREEAGKGRKKERKKEFAGWKFNIFTRDRKKTITDEANKNMKAVRTRACLFVELSR